MSRTLRLFGGMWLIAVLLCGCRREAESRDDARAPDTVVNKPKQADLLTFPDDLRVAEGSVNDFVSTAMTVCAGGDYERFRLLWTARENPLPREEFEEGWHAVRRIEVRALKKVLLEADAAAGRDAPQTVYALLVDVSLDPSLKAGQKEPVRHVVLMIVPENEHWRLAKAPKAMREWIKEQVAGGPSGGGTGPGPPGASGSFP